MNINNPYKGYFKEGEKQVRSFYDDDEVIHIIKNMHCYLSDIEEVGLKEFMVVQDDAYFLSTGNLTFMSKEEIKSVYGIDL